MSKITATCAVCPTDTITAQQTPTGRIRICMGEDTSDVFLDDHAALDFARGIIALVEPAQKFRVGDRVIIVSEFAHTADDRKCAASGKAGRIRCYDSDDSTYPYDVLLDEGGALWVHSVRAEVTDTAQESPREALYKRTMALLGSAATVTDRLALACFLGGE